MDNEEEARWARAVDERDRMIAELRRWAETAQAGIASRDAAIVRLQGALTERDEAAELRRAGYANVVAALQERLRLLEDQVAAAATRGAPDWHLRLVPNGEAYALVANDGPPPAPGERIDGGTVARVGTLAEVPCAYLLD
jgi:hypothetical protein